MKKYLLVRVVERDIEINQFETRNEAEIFLRKDFNGVLACELDSVTDFSLSDNGAYVDSKDCEYDWAIFELAV